MISPVTLAITLYRSRQDLPALLAALDEFTEVHRDRYRFECVFVSDGSPDDSVAFLKRELPGRMTFDYQVIELTRNFGATFAQRCALKNGHGDYFCQLAPDLQEPLEFITQALARLSTGKVEICYGVPQARPESFSTRIFSALFWTVCHFILDRNIPVEGIGTFAFTRAFRDAFFQIDNQSQFLTGLTFRIKMKREFLPYVKLARKQGKSSWTVKKKVRYFSSALFVMLPLPFTQRYSGSHKNSYLEKGPIFSCFSSTSSVPNKPSQTLAGGGS